MKILLLTVQQRTIAKRVTGTRGTFKTAVDLVGEITTPTHRHHGWIGQHKIRISAGPIVQFEWSGFNLKHSALTRTHIPKERDKEREQKESTTMDCLFETSKNLLSIGHPTLCCITTQYFTLRGSYNYNVWTRICNATMQCMPGQSVLIGTVLQLPIVIPAFVR